MAEKDRRDEKKTLLKMYITVGVNKLYTLMNSNR